MCHEVLEPRRTQIRPAPANVTQAGHHNTNIAHVNKAFMPVFVSTGTPATTVGTPAGTCLDPSCYHLFVVGDEDFSSDRFYIHPRRALTEYTAEDLNHATSIYNHQYLKNCCDSPRCLWQKIQAWEKPHQISKRRWG